MDSTVTLCKNLELFCCFCYRLSGFSYYSSLWKLHMLIALAQSRVGGNMKGHWRPSIRYGDHRPVFYIVWSHFSLLFWVIIPLQEAHCLSYAWSYHKHALQYANKTGIDEKKRLMRSHKKTITKVKLKLIVKNVLSYTETTKTDLWVVFTYSYMHEYMYTYSYIHMYVLVAKIKSISLRVGHGRVWREKRERRK